MFKEEGEVFSFSELYSGDFNAENAEILKETSGIYERLSYTD